MNKQLVLAAALLLFSLVSQATEVVEIPEEELARESVLPIFDTPDVVKNRAIPLPGKIEFGAFLGMNVNEAFYDQTLYGAQATYHLTDMSGIGIMFSMIEAKSSQYVPQLNEVSTPPLHYELLPKPKYFFLLNYEFTPFYGKMSITKQAVINLTTFATIGLGMFALGDTQTPVLGIGLGQNFFFGKSWGMKIDMRGLIYQGIDPVSVDVNSYGGQTPSTNDYQRQTVVNFTVSGGLIVLL